MRLLHHHRCQIPHLRPPPPGGRRRRQVRLAGDAPRRRVRVLLDPLTLRRRRQPRARVPGLPAGLAIGRPHPLRDRGLPPGLRPDRFLRRRDRRVRTVHAQPAVQLRQPQLQPFPSPRSAASASFSPASSSACVSTTCRSSRFAARSDSTSDSEGSGGRPDTNPDHHRLGRRIKQQSRRVTPTHPPRSAAYQSNP